MNILYLGSFRHAWHTETYIASALRELGHEVTTLEETRTSSATSIDTAKHGKFDLFLAAKCRFTETRGEFDGNAGRMIAAFMGEMKQHVPQVALWQFDCLAPDFCPERFAWAKVVAPACDVFACTDGFTAPQLPNAGVVRQGIPLDLDHEADWPTEYAGDVLWLGSVYRERHELADNLRARFGNRFAIVNDVRGRALTKLCRSYRVVVGPYYPAFNGYESNRRYVVCGAGALFACPPTPWLESEGWQPGVNYLALPGNPASITATLADILERTDREQLRAIQLAGYALAKTLTYRRRCEELLRHLSRLSADCQ